MLGNNVTHDLAGVCVCVLQASIIPESYCFVSILKMNIDKLVNY